MQNCPPVNTTMSSVNDGSMLDAIYTAQRLTNF